MPFLFLPSNVVSELKEQNNSSFLGENTLSFKPQNTTAMNKDVDAEVIFSEGRVVEVTSDEEGYKGAWFTATILKLPRNKTKGRALVRYKNLLEEDNETPFTEHVKLSFIRPVPPQIPGDQCFEVKDVVDAFHLDGWWTGSVSEVLDNPKRYIVSFADPPDKIEFSSSDLRPHREWVDGKWVKSSKLQEALVSFDCQEQVELSCNTTKDAGKTIQFESSDAVKCSSKKHECCVSSTKNGTGLWTASEESAKSKQVNRVTLKYDAMPLHPSKKSKDGSLENSFVPESHTKVVLVSSDSEEQVEVSCNTIKGAATTIQLESSDAVKSSSKTYERRLSSTKNGMGLSTASKEPSKSKSVKRVTPEDDAMPFHPSKKSKDGGLDNSLVPESHMKDTDQLKVEGVREENVGLLRRSRRLLNFHVKGPQHPGADKMDYIKAAAAIDIFEVQQMTKEVESSVTRGLPIECLSGSVTEESHHVTKEVIYLQREDGAKTGINRIEQPHVVLNINQAELVPQISKSPYAEKDDAAGVLAEMVSEEHTATEVEPSAISGLEQPGSQTLPTERTAILSATDFQGKIIKVAGESGRILQENEEQSPLICCEELQSGVRKIHSVVMEENNSGHIPHGFANQGNDPREKSLQIVVHSPLAGMTGDHEPLEDRDLPFVKSLPIWKAVESMEIFQVMPQNPHFHPLVKLKEILREGLAVGHMLSFASLVERTSKLTVADPRNHFTSILDALPDLEILGFDVKAVRDRISDYLSVKDRHRHLEDHSKEVKLQVKQCSDELTKINKEIDANYKMVRELEEKQALLLSMKSSKISQITSLQVCEDVTTQDIQSVEHDFESLAASPW